MVHSASVAPINATHTVLVGGRAKNPDGSGLTVLDTWIYDWVAQAWVRGPDVLYGGIRFRILLFDGRRKLMLVVGEGVFASSFRVREFFFSCEEE